MAGTSQQVPYAGPPMPAHMAPGFQGFSFAGMLGMPFAQAPPPMQAAQPEHATPSTSSAAESHPPLGGIFDMASSWAPPRMPSPPPLPTDFGGEFDAAACGRLFDFGQFSHRMPSSQPVLNGHNKLVKDLTQEALDLAESNVVSSAWIVCGCGAGARHGARCK